MHTPTRNQPVRRSSSLGEALLERYSLDREAARTESGVLYDATDKGSKRRVSIEIANDLDDDARLSFERDAMISQRLEGEHVLRVTEVGALIDGTPFVVREPALGSLANDVSTRGPLPTSEAVAWTLEVCEALAEAHSRGIAHGDVRAETVFLGRDDAGNPIAKVRWTSKAKAEGTAREDVARDIAGAALLLRFLITGQPESDDDAVKTLPTELGHAVARATAKNEENRFRNIGELASILSKYAPPGHQSARNIAFLLSRAGIVGSPVAIPVSQRTTTPNMAVAVPPVRTSIASGVDAVSAPPPSSRRVPIGARLSQPGLNEEWFAPRPSRISEVPLAAPPPRRSNGAFAAVAMLLLGATLGGTLWLYSTGKLPQWSGTAPPIEEAKMDHIDRTDLVNTIAEDATLMTTPRALEGPGLVEWERWAPPAATTDDTEGSTPGTSQTTAPSSEGVTQAPMDTKPAMPSLGSGPSNPSSSSKAKTAPTNTDTIEPTPAQPWPGTTPPQVPRPAPTTDDTTPMAPSAPTTSPAPTSPRSDDPGF